MASKSELVEQAYVIRNTIFSDSKKRISLDLVFDVGLHSIPVFQVIKNKLIIKSYPTLDNAIHQYNVLDESC